MKKKWIKLFATLFVCATLALGFTACEDEGNNSPSSNSTNTEQGSSSGSGASSENNSGDDSSSSAPDSSSRDSSSEQTHTHNYTAVTTAPTCTEQGFTTYICTCGDEYIADYVNALNHKFTNYESNNNATCEQDGTETATCSRQGCEETDTRIEKKSALNHNYGTPSYEWNGQQCTATRICEKDNAHKEIETVTATYIKDTDATCTAPEKGHYGATFENDVFETQTTANNSVENGTKLEHTHSTLKHSDTEHWYECVCGDKKDVEGHTPSAPATETTDQICTECERVLVPSLGHVHILHLTKVEAKAQSCTETGNIEYYICFCEKWFTDNTATTEIEDKTSVIIAKDKHEYTELKNNETQHWYECVCGDKDGEEGHKGGTATCTKLAVCSICSESYGELEEHNHTELKHNNEQHWYECICGAYETKENHKGGTATCTQKAKCSVCSEEYGEANGHNYDSVVTAPTCTEQGYTTYTCHCEESYVADYVDALGHTEVIDNAVEPTCTETGLTQGKHCSVCKEVLIAQETVKANGHDYSSVVTAPTCTEQGYTTYTCHCEDSYVADYVDELGHNFVNYESNNNATCTEDGTETATCSREGCEEPNTRVDENSKLGHDYGTPSYEWNRQQCTATRICGRDNTHKETETVTATYVKDTDATCTAPENGHYEATFENPAFVKQETDANSVTKGVELGHSYTNYVLDNNATCTEDGTETATCSRQGCEEKDTRTTENSKLGFNYGEPEYIWNGNKCTAKRVCVNGCNHIETETVIAEYIKDTDATSKTPEKGHYEVTFENPAFEMQQTEANSVTVCEALGHSFANYVYNDDAKCEVNGTETATCDRLGCETIDTREKTDSALEHNYQKTEKVIYCTLSGEYQFYKCLLCSKEKQELINAKVDSHSLPEVHNLLSVGDICEYCGGEILAKNGNSLVIKLGDIYQVEHYAGATVGFSNYANVINSAYISNKVTEVGNSSFKNYTALTEVKVPQSVTLIASGAFSGCSALKKITIPFVGATLNEINKKHFGYIFGATSYSHNSSYVPSLLKEVTITNGESIATQAFYNCSSITSIEISDSIKNIGENAFSGCSSLTNVYFNGDVNKWVEITGLSYLMSELRTLYVNGVKPTQIVLDTAKTITSYAFNNCDALKSVIAGNNVTSIGSYAFYNCSSITSIEISDSIKNIGENAFSGCSSLTNVYFNGDVNKWVEITGLSYLMSELRTLYVNGVKPTQIVLDTAKTITSYAFNNCDALKSVIAGNNVTSIGESAFSGCSTLENITLPFVGASKTATSANSSTSFGYIFGINSFTGATATKQYYSSSAYITYYIPNSLKSVTVTGGKVLYGAFYNCSKLKSIIIEKNITIIGNDALKNCSSLTSITIPFVGASLTASNGYDQLLSYLFGGTANTYKNRVFNYGVPQTLKTVEITGGTSIGLNAFNGCSSLTNIVMPNSVTSIGSSAFSGCSSLTNIVIPNSVTSIGSGAFSGCSSLKSIEMSDSLTSIGESAFPRRTLEIYFNGNINKWPEITGLKNLMYPVGAPQYSRTLYINGELLTELVLTTATKIPSYAFSNCDSLKSIVIGDSVTSIDAWAFVGCSSLETMTLPFIGASLTASNGYDQVLGWIFGVGRASSDEDWHYFGDNPLNDGWNGYGYYYYGIPASLKEVTITGGAKITAYAFNNCTSLTRITLPNSITSIESGDSYKKTGAFSNCTSLKTIIFEKGSGLITIGNYAFYNCGSLTNITIPDSVKSIGDYAFKNCSSLISITIPNTVTDIGYYGVFQNCVSLKTAVFETGGKFTTIGNLMFNGCTSLISITIPNSVKNIGPYAFSGCSSLKTVTFENTTGWETTLYGSGTGPSIDVTTPSANATYLTSTYESKNWWRT